MQWQTRTVTAEFETREENGAPVIEGYFAVFNSNYDIFAGLSESIAPGAFSKTLSGDIRALINHESTLVLGRTSAHTLELREDSRGLWGRIMINPNDSDAMNLYERVKRGDVSQCSPDEWLERFNTFSIYEVLPKLIELWGLNVETQVESKKISFT